MDLEVVGRHAFLFDDDGMAAFVNSGDALVDWNSLQIDRYDVRHLLSGPLPPRRRLKPQAASNTADSSLNAELDHERYVDLPLPSDEPEVEEAEKPEDAAYHSVGFSYGSTDESAHQINAEGGLECGSFRPPFNVPETLVHSLMLGAENGPPTEKVHQIIARTATFVSKHGGQSEIILRVKQGDNPTFGFLMPDHNLHAYYRFLVDHPEILQSESDANTQTADVNADQKSKGAEGALSLLGSVYGEDDDSFMDDEREFGNVDSEKMNAGSSIASHVAGKTDFNTNTASKDVVPKDPLHRKDKPSTVKKNPSISAPKVGRTSSLKKEDVSGSHSASSEDLGKSLILEPPPDLKVLVEKIVDFITKNGKQFEASLREQDSKQGRFPFLVPSNQYHPYYLTVLKKAEESRKGPEKKASSHKEDDSNSALYSDMPFESDRKEKFKMIIAKSKKDSPDHESKPAQQDHGISIDAEAAAAILQAATRGFKNPYAGIIPSSSRKDIQPLGSESKQCSDLSDKSSVSDAKAMGKADASETANQPDSDPPLTKEQKLKAERLKRAKMFVAMLKSGTVQLKDEKSGALSIEPSEPGGSVSPDKVNHETGESRHSGLVDYSTSEKIENAEGKDAKEEYTERRSKRKYRSRCEGREHNDDEEMEGNHSEQYENSQNDEEKSHNRSRKKHHSRQDNEHDKDYEGEKSNKRSRKRHRSHSSSHKDDDEEISTNSSLHRHSRKVREKSHRKSGKKHRSRGSPHEDDNGERTSDSSAHQHSSKQHSSHRHKHEDDEKKAEKRSRRKHRSHHSSHSRKERPKKTKAHSSEDEGSEYGHYGDKYSEEKKRSVLRSEELEEGEISPKVSDKFNIVDGGQVSREASADAARTHGRASSQPSETIHVSDDLKAKVRALLMTSM